MNPQFAFIIFLNVALAYGLFVLASKLARYLRRRKSVNIANAANQPGAGESLNGYRTYLATSVTAWTTFTAAYTNSVQPPGRFALVKLDTANPGQILMSSADTDLCIGVAQDSPDSALDPVAVRLFSAPGTMRMVAAGVIAINAVVCSNGDGAAKAWLSGSSRYPIGIAMIAAGAAGDIIEVQPMPSSVAS